MAAKRKTNKKASLKNMAQAHGKVEEFEPTTLDQVWGDNGMNTYGTMDEVKYQTRLDDMNMSDMQSHASQVGIIPIDNRNMLRDRLLREFRKHVAAYQRPITPIEEPQVVDKEIQKILSEGRYVFKKNLHIV